MASKEVVREVLIDLIRTDERVRSALRDLFMEVLLKAMKSLEEELRALREQVSKNTSAIKRLEEQVARNTEAIKRLEEQVARNTEAIKRLEIRLEKLEEQVARNTKAIKELSAYLREMLHILQEASGLKTEEDLRAFLDAAVYDFGLRVQKYKTKSGHDVDILLMDSKFKAIEIKRTVYDSDVKKFLQVVEELKEELKPRKALKPLIVCNADKIRDPALRKLVEVIEFAEIRKIPLSSRRVQKIQEKLRDTDLFERDILSLRAHIPHERRCISTTGRLHPARSYAPGGSLAA